MVLGVPLDFRPEQPSERPPRQIVSIDKEYGFLMTNTNLINFARVKCTYSYVRINVESCSALPSKYLTLVGPCGLTSRRGRLFYFALCLIK